MALDRRCESRTAGRGMALTCSDLGLQPGFPPPLRSTRRPAVLLWRPWRLAEKLQWQRGELALPAQHHRLGLDALHSHACGGAATLVKHFTVEDHEAGRRARRPDRATHHQRWPSAAHLCVQSGDGLRAGRCARAGRRCCGRGGRCSGSGCWGGQRSWGCLGGLG